MRRTIETTLELRDDGREVYGRIVPFGVRAHIRERVDGALDEYDEEFLPGCTTRMRQIAQARGGAPAWIRFTIDHEQTLDARLGYCRALDEADDGAYGTFQLYDGLQLAKARSMLAESHRGLSIEFDDITAPLVDGELRRRRAINITAVTATPIPVYAGAGILAMREGDPLDAATPRLDAVRALLADLDA